MGSKEVSRIGLGKREREGDKEGEIQGYIAITADGTEVRLRKKGTTYFQTVKSGEGKIRRESEIEITKEQFDVLWDCTDEASHAASDGDELENQEGRERQPKEIERKFLVASVPDDFEQYPHKDIVQGYIAITADGTEVRLRKKGTTYFQTVKSGEGKIRRESEIEITKEQFDVLWDCTEGRRLEKTRYLIPYKDTILELDVYEGDLRGLVVVEVEFSSEELSEKFELPAWFGEETTEDKRYKNQSLALHGDPRKKE